MVSVVMKKYMYAMKYLLNHTTSIQELEMWARSQQICDQRNVVHILCNPSRVTGPHVLQWTRVKSLKQFNNQHLQSKKAKNKIAYKHDHKKKKKEIIDTPQTQIQTTWLTRLEMMYPICFLLEESPPLWTGSINPMPMNLSHCRSLQCVKVHWPAELNCSAGRFVTSLSSVWCYFCALKF